MNICSFQNKELHTNGEGRNNNTIKTSIIDVLDICGGQGWGRTNFPLRQECITINATHPYYPRSIHTHFQGLCVVFALLISIPSGRLTEHCCSHLLWLCDTVESGLLPRFVCSQEIRENLLHDFLHPFAPLLRWKGDPLLITFILYHNFVDLSRGFQKFVQKFFYKVLWGLGLLLFRILFLWLHPSKKVASCVPPIYIKGFVPLLTLLLYHNFLFLSSTFSKIIKKIFIGLCEIFNNLRPGRLSPPGPARAQVSPEGKRGIFSIPLLLLQAKQLFLNLLQET